MGEMVSKALGLCNPGVSFVLLNYIASADISPIPFRSYVAVLLLTEFSGFRPSPE